MFNGPDTVIDGNDTASLAATADRLRAVRRAHGRFLALWAVDHLLSDDAAVGRLSADVTPDNHADLIRSLFRGGRLDD